MNFTVHVNDERVDGDISAVLLSLADAVGELYGDENVVVGSDPHLNDPCDLRLEGEDLVAERDALRDRLVTLEAGILAKCEQWEAEQPDALAYEVTDSFRRLLHEEADR